MQTLYFISQIYNINSQMSINIFQFLKQGTSFSSKSLQTNKQLEQKINPQKRQPNQHFLLTGQFTDSNAKDELQLDGSGELNQQKLKHLFNQKVQKSNQLRKRYHIHVQGSDIPFVFSSFNSLAKNYNIDEKLLFGLAQMGFIKPTAVQMQAIPALLEQRNVLVTAPTGTGKTISYLIPVLHNILKKRCQVVEQEGRKSKKQKKRGLVFNQIETVIITPQQELSNQIIGQLEQLTKRFRDQQEPMRNNTIQNITSKCISALTDEQKDLIKNNKPFGVNILITTPLLFLNIFGQNFKQTQFFSQTKCIIMDECDKYFEQSFLEQIRSILQVFSTIKPKPHYGLFSATIQHPIEQLLKTELLDDAIRVQVGGQNKVLTNIDQSIEYCTNEYGKILELKNMIAENRFIPPAIIFVQQKLRAKQLYYQVKKIMKNGPGGMDLSRKIEVLSGDKSKENRREILENFENGTFLILITTDLVARGIDFSHVNLVINYDFPNTMINYIHRVGRTGRAERTGRAVTFFTDEDKPIVKSLGNLLHVSGCKVPEWILELPKVDKKLKKRLEKYPVKRMPVGVSQGRDKNFDKQLQKMEKIWKRKKERQEARQKKQGVQQQQSQWVQA